jgi:2-polyprenyl-3-methyl-5-hydroxy-6-metoxy-1,4-benzoquinol methylase
LTGRALFGCPDCLAEWIEGDTGIESAAYSYGHVERDPLVQDYLSSRAGRFVRYLRALAPHPGRLLDVGCGGGHFMLAAASAGWECIGAELADEAAQVARDRTGMPVIAGDASRWVASGKHYDAVCLWGVVEHVTDPATLLEAAHSVLRPGGLLVLETPNAAGMFRKVSRLASRASRGRIVRPLLETLGAGHVVWLSRTSVRPIFARTGFDVVDIRGSQNHTGILMHRFAGLPPIPRLAFSAGTAVLNTTALPLGAPNQLLAAGRKA